MGALVLELAGLPEVHPGGNRQQDDREDPEGRIAHSSFLGHRSDLKLKIEGKRNQRQPRRTARVNIPFRLLPAESRAATRLETRGKQRSLHEVPLRLNSETSLQELPVRDSRS